MIEQAMLMIIYLLFYVLVGMSIIVVTLIITLVIVVSKYNFLKFQNNLANTHIVRFLQII
jgi:hypothetical protein